MKLSEVILVALDGAGGQLAGRTRLQKVMYFLCERLGIDAGYFPHFYGPYSEQVAGAVDSLVARDLVEEEAESTATGGPFEGRLYTYSLGERGREVLAFAEEREGERARRVREELAGLLSEKPSTQALAVASKLHIILPKSDSVSDEELRRKAANLGWDLRTANVQEGIAFLVSKAFADRD